MTEKVLTLNNLGTVYLYLRQDEQAITYCEQALALIRAVENRQGEALALNNLGLAYEHLGQHAAGQRGSSSRPWIHRPRVRDRAGEGHRPE